ncbi:hypothetical protein CCR75_003727 [Bremia lactucae]|uniref:Glucosidase 2 subunit beta n=1 Tax=Bremia lactucae TaxID=4779 RepID=A0A976IJP6_BRELC|nr:hypothetical protein CCR75_003727 [Bremia lactucae]
MTRLLCTLAQFHLLRAVLSSPSPVPIRGVAPIDQSTYLSAGLSCIVGGKVTNLPISRVNDEYCDCEDGRDEPGTAACSHLTTAFFYCKNSGFLSEKIPTSRIHDGICDCCDGSDEEIDSKSPCFNTCATAADEYRREAEQWLKVVTAGFEVRKEVVNGKVATYFDQEQERENLIQKELKELNFLKDRVTVHKNREEFKEKKYRMEIARQKQEEVHLSSDMSQKPLSEQEEDVDSLVFEELDAFRVADVEMPINTAEDKRASEVLNSKQDVVKSRIELPDGTHIPLAEYLRIGPDNEAFFKTKATGGAEEMRQDNLLKPISHGQAERQRKIGLYALRTIGIVISPIRALIEFVLLCPRIIWDVLSSPEIFGSVVDKLPKFPYPSRFIWFRQFGGGSLYDTYSSVVWAARVVWDAPVYAYYYLFPQLNDALKLPVAESLRKVLSEIDAAIELLEQEHKDNLETGNIDYGPDRAYFALKDKCIEKRIEKYVYKFCAFGEIKQDTTRLGKWAGWETADTENLSLSRGTATFNYTKMQFLNGQRCYNGPDRSVLVHLQCGKDDEILSVDEPSTCVYEMVIRSPLACSPEVVAKALRDVAFWAQTH